MIALVLLLIALVVFVLGLFGVATATKMILLGLAFTVGAFIVERLAARDRRIP